MKGRPPKSTKELKAKGTFEKCKQGDRAKQPTVEGVPAPPEDFTDRQVYWWNHYIKDIQSFTVLTEPHLNSIALLSRLMVEREKLDEQIQTKGHTFETSSGQVKINPAFQARLAVDKEIIKLYEQFGFTLRSSMNLKVDKPKQQTSKILEMMKGGKTKVS